MFTFKFLCVIPFILSGHFRVKYDVNVFHRFRHEMRQIYAFWSHYEDSHYTNYSEGKDRIKPYSQKLA